jgi:holo-[acyl-carrier protein] synthase
MIVGTGIDLAETDRIQQALQKYGDHFLRRVFTPQEFEYCERFKNRAERYAARFAAKEAAFKALGTGWTQGVRWVDVEVVHLPSGKPELTLAGKALEVAQGLRVSRISVSLSHALRYVVAHVIFESDG